MSAAVVAGGGPAGAAVAAILAGAGRDVLVLERDPAPADKVCGDFLSIEAQAALTELGLDLAALGPPAIDRVRIARGARIAEAALPFRALGLSRRTLDAALLDLAAARGATVRRGVRVQSLGQGPAVATSEGVLRPQAVFLATGKHELRGAARGIRAAKSVGFKTYLALAPSQREAVRGAVELVLFDGGYAGMLLVEGEAANLSLVVSAARLAREGGTWEGLLDGLLAECPLLATRFAGAEALRPRPLAVSGIPYGFVHAPSRADPPALYRVGDQAAVIPSLTGDGVAIALHSARRAADSYLAGRGAAAHHAALRGELLGQMRRASVIHRACLVPALQPTIVAACGVAPWVMRVAAAWTRVPSPRPSPGGRARSDEALSLRESVG